MQIGIISGTGLEGRGLAARLATAGFTTLIGSREVHRAREVVRSMQANTPLPELVGATNAEAIERSDVVFLAVPFAHAEATLLAHGHHFRSGTVLVDLTVPLDFTCGKPALLDVSEGSATEFVRARLPQDVRLAGALKTIPAAALGRLDVPLECDDFVCGDSPESRSATIEVLKRIPGLRPIDVGGLENAHTLELMTLLAIGINKRYRVRASRFRMAGL